MINVTSCVQSVLHLQPHTLEVSFATLQLLYQLCAMVRPVRFLSNPELLIPALKWMVSIIKTYCLRQIFCPIIRSSRITSHFSRTEPQRIGLAKLSNSWKSRRQTSFHQICGNPTAQISTKWTTGSGAYCKNGFTRQAVRMTTSYVPDCWGMGQAWPALLIKQLESGERDFKRVACVAAGGGYFEHKM